VRLPGGLLRVRPEHIFASVLIGQHSSNNNSIGVDIDDGPASIRERFLLLAVDNKDDPTVGAGMIDGLPILSVPGEDVGDLSSERAPSPVSQSNSEMGGADRTLLRVRIIEVADGPKTELAEDYHFQQLPAPNDQIVMPNRRGSYDVTRVLYSAREPETTVYVRWVARR
jgi:hypothetical protein